MTDPVVNQDASSAPTPSGIMVRFGRTALTAMVAASWAWLVYAGIWGGEPAAAVLALILPLLVIIGAQYAEVESRRKPCVLVVEHNPEARLPGSGDELAITLSEVLTDEPLAVEYIRRVLNLTPGDWVGIVDDLNERGWRPLLLGSSRGRTLQRLDRILSREDLSKKLDVVRDVVERGRKAGLIVDSPDLWLSSEVIASCGALMVRDLLSRRDLARIYMPFERIIPYQTLTAAR